MQRYPPVTWQGTIPYNWRFPWENRLWIMDFPLPRLIVEVHFTSWIREIAIHSISRLTTMLTRRHCSISYLYTNIYICIYMCNNIYIYTYMCNNIYIYIYIYIQYVHMPMTYWKLLTCQKQSFWCLPCCFVSQ
jgi:hypothetical protein